MLLLNRNKRILDSIDQFNIKIVAWLETIIFSGGSTPKSQDHWCVSVRFFPVYLPGVFLFHLHYIQI